MMVVITVIIIVVVVTTYLAESFALINSLYSFNNPLV